MKYLVSRVETRGEGGATTRCWYTTLYLTLVSVLVGSDTTSAVFVGSLPTR